MGTITKPAILGRVKNVVKRTLVYDLVLRNRGVQVLKNWEAAGFPDPPPEYFKQLTVKQYALAYGLHVFIETGTFRGNMVRALRRQFSTIYSIELDWMFYEAAKRRFAGYPHIKIIHGDSGTILREILATISEPCLFWLDAHYSGGSTAKGFTDTPIKEELACILTHPISNHVILIDDARCFDGRNGYPTIEDIRGYVREFNKPYSVSVEHDIIRII